MMIFKKAIDRRTFLKGAGATIALPFLDSMLPALAAARDKIEPAKRFSVVYTPNGMNMSQWTPQTTGRNFDLSPSLQPFAKYKDKLHVLWSR